jgi:ABC-type transporter Mla subunit MlaD
VFGFFRNLKHVLHETRQLRSELQAFSSSFVAQLVAARRDIERTMGTLNDIAAKIAQIGETIETEKQEVATAITALRDQVAALQLQIEQGTAATPADLDAVLAQLDALNSSVADITVPGASA